MWEDVTVCCLKFLWRRTDSWLKFLLVGWNPFRVHDSALSVHIMAATTYLHLRVQAHFIYECTDGSIAITVTTTVTQMFVHQRQRGAGHKTTRLFSILK